MPDIAPPASLVDASGPTIILGAGDIGAGDSASARRTGVSDPNARRAAFPTATAAHHAAAALTPTAHRAPATSAAAAATR